MATTTWDALGNVYHVVDGTDGGRLSPDEVRAMCGSADGVVEVLAVRDDEAEVVIWNADGTTAEMSGNGTRIAACWLARRSGADQVRVRVADREVAARILDRGAVETDMGDVEVHGREHVAGVELTVVSVGNPHVVILRDPADVTELGPLLATHPRFERGTNVEVARVDSPGEVTARVWERGVGETTASGTGAVAVAAATHRDGDVTVRFPGGALRVRLRDGRAVVTGPAVEVSASR